MRQATWDIARLTDLGMAYWSSSVLHAALRTGLAAELVRGPAAADELARRLELDPRATAMLLEAMAALDLVVIRQGAAELAPAWPSCWTRTATRAYTTIACTWPWGPRGGPNWPRR